MKCKIILFFIVWALFLEMYIFEVLTFFLVILTQYFHRQFVYIRFMFLMKNVFLVGAITMMTEKLSFPCFHDSHCQEDKFLHPMMQFINPEYQ